MKLTRRMMELFSHGYDSGDIARGLEDPLVAQEYSDSGGNYKTIFETLIRPTLETAGTILEIGPGGGSWSRIVLSHLSHRNDTVLHAADLLPLESHLRRNCPNAGERLVFHQIEEVDYSRFDDQTFDFVFSIGVFVHLRTTEIAALLKAVRPKIKPSGRMVVHYANWDKLERYGWEKGRVPLSFKQQPDDPSVWWPPNDCNTMARLITQCGYAVLNIDTGHMQRDSIAIIEASM